MKVLLDECLPRKLKGYLVGHECQTVPEVGLAGRKNGELLLLAEEAGFGVFLTIDRGLEYQQNLRSRKLSVILLRGKSNRLSDLIPLVPDVLVSLSSLVSGQLIRIELSSPGI
jgi:Domain of unknown function (DUF5615)